MKNREFERLQKKRLKKDIKLKIKDAKSAIRTPKKNGKKKVAKKKQKNAVPTHMSSKQIEKMAREVIRQHKNEQDNQEFEHVR